MPFVFTHLVLLRDRQISANNLFEICDIFLFSTDVNWLVVDSILNSSELYPDQTAI